MSQYVQFTVLGLRLRFTRGWLAIALTLVAITIYITSPTRLTGNEQLIWIFATTIVVAGGAISLFLHEFAHARIARTGRSPFQVAEPALIGALPDTLYDPESPRQDVRVAVAGPVMNLILACPLGLLWYVMSGNDSWAVDAIGILALVNIALAITNLMPGYPFDGGRVFRAFIWYLTDNLMLATRWAAVYGYVLMTVGLAGGVFLLSAGNQPAVWGAWILLTVWMLNRSIAAGSRQIVWLENGRRLRVDDIFFGSGRRLAADMTIDDAIEPLLEAYGHGPTLVIKEGEAIGTVDLRSIRPVPRALWTERTLADISRPLDDKPRVSDQAPLIELISLLPPGSADIALIEKQGRVIAATDRTLVIDHLQDYLHAERMEKLRRRL